MRTRALLRDERILFNLLRGRFGLRHVGLLHLRPRVRDEAGERGILQRRQSVFDGLLCRRHLLQQRLQRRTVPAL